VHVEEVGSGPRVVLVHGSVAAGWATWSEQRPLAERFRLIVPSRPGFPPNPEAERIDFEVDAPLIAGLLDPPAHLVGHSYGGLISLLAAALRPEAVLSLTVVEPPAFSIARGDAEVDRIIALVEEHWDTALRDPETFLRRFLALVGSPFTVERLSATLLQGARALMVERLPHEATIPLDVLRAAPFRKLVVSGAHSAAFDAVADVLERDLPAERAVLPGAGHSVPRLGRPFNERLLEFLTR
jgi:pimeloyl-ACP methyl ester carboxylesterase